MSRTSITKWLYFGLHIKRWLFLLLVGVAVMGLGIAYLLREVYVSYVFPEWVAYATLQFIPRWARGMLFIVSASGITLFAGWRLNRSLAESLLPGAPNGQIVDLVYARRTQERGPRIVAIGGGTGLSNLLRGLKQYTSNLTAIVTVADDGGSSGRLRRDMQVIPPGDIRNCIAALADAEPLVTELFQYRFDERAGQGIAGHSFGNLFIAAMAEVTGNMEAAIAETSRVLAVRGQIVPSTHEDIVLGARLADGRIVRGESVIPKSGSAPVEAFIEPREAAAHPRAVRALLDADLVLIGPGSLYTSVLPNLLVPGIGRALLESKAHKVYISNVATQHGETDGFSAADHYGAIRSHLGVPVVDVVLANSNLPQEPLPAEWCSEPVLAAGDADYAGARLVLSDLVDTELRYSHDTTRLASAVMRLYFERDLRVQAAALAEA
ncbi:MAG: uridine diphosphate-N-acetylglucosamine-binding protein YvcK [Dehalococcoidia bacterium]|nr:uridine diphosphate-N-acetylglucosamine-binding protein YvcK [Dehalococcoidia bacterium]